MIKLKNLNSSPTICFTYTVLQRILLKENITCSESSLSTLSVDVSRRKNCLLNFS